MKRGRDADPLEDEAADAASIDASAAAAGARVRCPYLDTVNRAALDFDMSPTCSVSLTRLGVYCCLICGKNFSGRWGGIVYVFGRVIVFMFA